MYCVQITPGLNFYYWNANICSILAIYLKPEIQLLLALYNK